MDTMNATGSATCCAVAVALDDTSLVHACKQGDVDAFEPLVKRYDAKLFRIAQHITHNREDAEEVVQEAFLKAFRNLGSFQEKSQFSTWLFRITVNESLMKLRKQRYAPEVSIDGDSDAQEALTADQVADWAPNPEQLYSAVELRAILRSQLQELQPNLRVTFVLRDREGLSTEQAAEVLGVTVEAVKARLSRARLRLRELLTNYFALTRRSFQRPTATTAVF
jgi:RNA polymerase sigma-70 factor (ECF subfamily)